MGSDLSRAKAPVALYFGDVMHARLKPMGHRFSYRVMSLLIDLGRLAHLLSRIRGRIVHQPLDAVSPLAVPVMLEIGREPVYGEADDALLEEAANELVEEAMRLL